jgi:glycosyltransferase involved in cell wall biosynthesis
MRVLLIGPFPEPINGCSYANKVLLKNLQLKDVRTQILNTNTNVLSSFQGSKFSIKKFISFLHTYLNSGRIFFSDIVYITPGQTFYGILKYGPFILLCLMLRRPYIIHLHGNYLGQEFQNLQGVNKRIFKYLISRASAGIVLSKTLSKNFHGLLPLEKIFVVENFVEKNLYEVKCNKKFDKLRIIYLSNLMLEKGIIDLLDALIDLQSSNIDFEAIIAGGIESSLENDVFSRLEKLDNKVQYVGTITGNKKKNCLNDANVFILPTYYKMEGQPISLLEGMATGNIIITTNHAGIPDIVSNSNGFIVSPKTYSEISECLKIISMDLKFYLEKYSNYNIKYANEYFTEEIFSNKIISIFQNVAKS